MEADSVILERKDVEEALANSARLFGSQNDWMSEVMEIATLPAVREWIKQNTCWAMVVERAGGADDPSRERFSSLEDWRAHFYTFPGYVLKSTIREGCQYNAVPTCPEESEARGYSHSAQHVIEGLRRDWPEIYWQLVYFLNTVRNRNYMEKNLRIVLQEDS
jgi:hypothetical protein